MWYIHALILLVPSSWGPEKVESETISLLKMSKAAIGDWVNIQLALVSILSNIKSKDLDSIKNRFYSLYTDVKLQECAPNLPEGFFPNYTNVKEYCKILRDLKSSKSSSLVEKHASTNKKACHFNKGQNSNHSHESPANKDSDNKVILEDEKKEKGPENPMKRAQWQGKKDKAKKD